MMSDVSSSSKITLDQGRHVMERRLKAMGLTVSEKETPADGSCMFHGLLDQIDSHPSLPPYADNHWELRYKIVCEGYEKFIDKLEWPNDPKVGSKLAWKGKMMNPNTWGDEVVLQLASSLLEVDIHVITAFNGVTIIKPVDVTSQKQPIYLFLFSENDFESAHYQSVCPSSSLPSSLPSSHVEVTEVFSFNQDNQLMSDLEITEESIRDIQVVVADQPCRYYKNVNSIVYCHLSLSLIVRSIL